jgi:hypothetical protein
MIGDMVDGKTVALVGPAPSVGDQQREVDAHDVVVRVGADHWPWRGYGDRIDIAVLDGFHSGRWLQNDLRTPSGVPVHLPKGVPVLLKAGYDVPDRLGFVCRPWPMWNPLQMTLTLWHFAALNPASVSVFGADFYVTPGKAYQETDWEYENTVGEKGVTFAHYVLGRSGTSHDHHPKQDMAIIRQLIADKGWPVGDERFMRVLAMSDEEYDAATAGWA